MKISLPTYDRMNRKTQIFFRKTYICFPTTQAPLLPTFFFSFSFSFRQALPGCPSPFFPLNSIFSLPPFFFFFLYKPCPGREGGGVSHLTFFLKKIPEPTHIHSSPPSPRAREPASPLTPTPPESPSPRALYAHSSPLLPPSPFTS